MIGIKFVIIIVSNSFLKKFAQEKRQNIMLIHNSIENSIFESFNISPQSRYMNDFIRIFSSFNYIHIFFYYSEYIFVHKNVSRETFLCYNY